MQKQLTTDLSGLCLDAHKLQFSTSMVKIARLFPRHRNNFSAKVLGHLTGWLRKPTLTYFIAGPHSQQTFKDQDKHEKRIISV